MPAGSGRYPSGQRGQTVNLLAYAFGGSNPPLPTIATRDAWPALSVAGLSQEGVAATGGNSSAVERQPSKLGVAGSNPVSRSTVSVSRARRGSWVARGRCAGLRGNRAHVAQTAERVLGKDEVSGSIPDMGSILVKRGIRGGNGR